MSQSPHQPGGGRLIIFQENGAGQQKIAGIEKYGQGIVITALYDLAGPFPEFIDEPEPYFPREFDGDLVLSFLRHPDLLAHLARLCLERGLPLIASGKKAPGALTPFTCCGLGRLPGLGAYGEQFGFPELALTLDEENRISSASVLRGASCGATWEALARIIGLPLAEALVSYAREVQYLCQADPSAFDPVSGKSAVHYAGHAHAAALKKAAAEWEQSTRP